MGIKRNSGLVQPDMDATTRMSRRRAERMNRDAVAANGENAGQFMPMVEGEDASFADMIDPTVIQAELSPEQWRNLYNRNAVKFTDIPDAHRSYVFNENIRQRTQEAAPGVLGALAAPVVLGETIGLAAGTSPLYGMLQPYAEKALGAMKWMQPSTYINAASAGQAGAAGMIGAAAPTTTGMLADFAFDAAMAKPAVERIMSGESRSADDIVDAATSFLPYTPVGEVVHGLKNLVGPALGAAALPFLRIADNANDAVNASHAARDFSAMSNSELQHVIDNTDGLFNEDFVRRAVSEQNSRSAARNNAAGQSAHSDMHGTDIDLEGYHDSRIDTVEGRRNLWEMSDDDITDLYDSLDDNDPANIDLLNSINYELTRRLIASNGGDAIRSESMYSDEFLENIINERNVRADDVRVNEIIQQELNRRHPNGGVSSGENVRQSVGERLNAIGNVVDRYGTSGSMDDFVDAVDQAIQTASSNGRQIDPRFDVINSLPYSQRNAIEMEAIARGCSPEDIVNYLAGNGSLNDYQTTLSDDYSNLAGVVFSRMLNGGTNVRSGHIGSRSFLDHVDDILGEVGIEMPQSLKDSMRTSIRQNLSDPAFIEPFEIKNLNDRENGLGTALKNIMDMDIDGNTVTIGGRRMNFGTLSGARSLDVEKIATDTVFGNIGHASSGGYPMVYHNGHMMPIGFRSNGDAVFRPDLIDFDVKNRHNRRSEYDDYASAIDDIIGQEALDAFFSKMSKTELESRYANLVDGHMKIRSNSGRSGVIHINKGTKQHGIDKAMEKRAVELGLAEDGKHITDDDIYRMARKVTPGKMSMSTMLWSENFGLSRNSRTGRYTGYSQTNRTAVEDIIKHKENANKAHIDAGGDPNNLPYPDIPERHVSEMQMNKSNSLWKNIIEMEHDSGGGDVFDFIKSIYGGDLEKATKFYDDMLFSGVPDNEFADFVEKARNTPGFEDRINGFISKYDIDDGSDYAVLPSDFIGEGFVDARVDIPEDMLRDYTSKVSRLYGADMRASMPRHSDATQRLLSTDSLPTNILGASRGGYGYEKGQYSVEFNGRSRGDKDYNYSLGDDMGTLKMTKGNVKNGVGDAAYENKLKELGYNDSLPQERKDEIIKVANAARAEAKASFNDDSPIVKELVGFFEGKHSDSNILWKYKDVIMSMVAKQQEKIHRVYRDAVNNDIRAREAWNAAHPDNPVEIRDYSDMVLPAIYPMPDNVSADEGIHLNFYGENAIDKFTGDPVMTETVDGRKVRTRKGFAVPTTVKHKYGGMLMNPYNPVGRPVNDISKYYIDLGYMFKA